MEGPQLSSADSCAFSNSEPFPESTQHSSTNAFEEFVNSRSSHIKKCAVKYFANDTKSISQFILLE